MISTFGRKAFINFPTIDTADTVLYKEHSAYVTVHSVHSNTLRDAQKSCIRMISRRTSRVFCELRSQKTPRGMSPVNSNLHINYIYKFSQITIDKFSIILYINISNNYYY